MPLFRVEDWDDAYANGANIPGGDRWPDAWVQPAADFRDRLADKILDLRYGENSREVMDLFRPAGTSRGLMVFVHGGFWLRLDKSYWSHLAGGAVARGWTVAMPSYPLCPEVRVRDIARSIARAVEAAASEVDGPIRLSGHSAGGHLVTRLVSEGTALEASVLGRVERIVSISGVHDLRPLLRTAMNETIGLDAEEAAAESPALLKPVRDISVICWVGANERSEFVRQNSLLANVWRGLGLATEAVEEPDRHHFDVIDGLAEPDSPIASTLLD
ncbi:alpha/beta hydrolase [Oricola cellulosilytica]|uniref:Alpha/beta hydrolase n=1 Tax=Oricola cellulosilytica TaxID=1429082 RepID=A0A4R0P7N0_9HYPH|nr:alpha/beta hydrolase [Oricola cellulosilytica]TCD11899.1 alpha/beta hydrolase [Oricola cellulosilytica]